MNYSLNFELIRIIIALAGTGVAAWQDARTSFIDDRLLWAMIAIGVILDLITFNQQFVLYSLGISVAIGAFGYYAYRTGQLGGGDVLLFAGLQVLLPVFPQTLLSWLGGILPIQLTARAMDIASLQAYPFIISVFFAAALLGMIGTSALYAWKLRKKKLIPDPLSSVAGLALAAVVLAVFNLILHANLAQNIAIIVLLTASVFLLAFKKQIMKEVIVTPVRIEEIEDEDVLATETMDWKLVAKYALGRVLTKAEVQKLKKIRKEKGIRRFPVYKHLPRFAPYIFGGLVVSLIFVDAIVFFIY